MKRAVNRWMVLDGRGELPLGVVPSPTRRYIAEQLWGDHETPVRVTITYDDGRPAPKRRTRAKREGGKRV